MKRLFSTGLIIFLLPFLLTAQTKFNGLEMNMGNLYRLSDAKTRSISPENFTGEKGKGGMATLEEGSAAKAAAEALGHRSALFTEYAVQNPLKAEGPDATPKDCTRPLLLSEAQELSSERST